MTRFARAKGSKSSNERHPEEATPWREMKQQMQKRLEQRQESKAVSPKIYMGFTESEISSSSWAQFEDGKPKKKKQHSKKEHRNDSVGKPTVSDSENSNSNKQRDMLHQIAGESSKVMKKISKKRRKESKLKGAIIPSIEDLNSEKTAEQEVCNQSNTKAECKVNLQTTKGTVNICRDVTSGYKKNEACGSIEQKVKIKNKPMFEKIKFKKVKERDGKFHKQRGSEDSSVTTMFINGKEIEVVKYDGFPVKKEDAIRLAELRVKLKSKGIPHESIVATMKLERRRAEKALARERKKVCFHCRKSGHILSDCPQLTETTESEAGICFKCGSTEHTHFQCKVSRDDDYRYASCFICKEQGHIARQCPDNPRGLYPKGGACRVCEAVTHLKKDCPNLIKEKEQQIITLKPLNNTALEALEDDLNITEPATKVKRVKKKKAVKF